MAKPVSFFSPPVPKRKKTTAKDHVLAALHSQPPDRLWEPSDVHEWIAEHRPDADITDIRVRQVMRELLTDKKLHQKGNNEPYTLSPQPLNGKADPADSDATDSSHHPSYTHDERLVEIEHLSVEASGGPGMEVHFEGSDGVTFLPAWYVRQEFGVSPDRVKRIRVHGDSMRGTVDAGQLVYVVLMDADQQPVHGGVYVIRSPHGLQIKRLYFDDESEVSDDGTITERRYVRIHSDNPQAGTDRIPLAVFQRFYRPLAQFRRVEAFI